MTRKKSIKALTTKELLEKVKADLVESIRRERSICEKESTRFLKNASKNKVLVFAKQDIENAVQAQHEADGLTNALDCIDEVFDEVSKDLFDRR